MRCEEVRTRIEEARLGLLPPAEQEDLDAHVASCEACAIEVCEVEAFENLLGQARDFERDAALVAALHRHREVRRRRGRLIRVLAGIAAVLLVLGVAYVLRDRHDLRPGETRTLAAGETVALPHAVVRGIGACRLRQEDDGRRVTLLDGAASFHVTPGHGPFIVETPAGQISVLGTEFEVRIMRKEALIAGAVVVVAAVATGVVLFGNSHGEVRVESQEIVVATPNGAPRVFGSRDIARLLEKNAALEKEVAELRRAAARAPVESPDPVPGPEARPEPVDEAVPTDQPVSVAATDWDKMGTIIADLVAADARGESSSKSPVLMLKMAYLVSRLRAIATEIGVEDENEVFYHPEVAPQFFRGMIKAVLPELDAKAREEVGTDLLKVLETERARWDTPLLAVEKHARDLELAVRITEQASSRLEPEQVRRLLQVVAADRPGGYSVSGIGQTDIEALKTSMGGMLASNHQLTGAAATEARRLGGVFIERHLAVRADTVRAHGAELVEAALWGNRKQAAEVAAVNPDFDLERTRIRAKIIRVQAEVERSLYLIVPEANRTAMLTAPLHIWLAFQTEAAPEDR